VTVMREGRTVLRCLPTAKLTQAELIRAMVGAELGAVYTEPHAENRSAEERPVALSVRHLSSAPIVKDVSFTVHAGEILGIGGLVGAGRSEAMEAIFGLRPRTAGEVLLGGRPL